MKALEPGDLGLLVPTRRPRNLERLWDSMQFSCTRGVTTLLAGVDTDDPQRDAYPAGPGYVIQDGLRYVTAWVNHLALMTLGRFRFIGHIGDDNTCDTPGWDARICKALEAQPFAFCNDLYPREAGSLSCHIFMRADVVKTLGYMGPPEISHMYVDVAWMAWCVSCGHEYLHDVLLPHHHYTLGAPHDDTYARSYARTAADLRAWHAYSRREGPGGLNDDIGKLGGVPFTPGVLASFNQRLNIPEEWPWLRKTRGDPGPVERGRNRGRDADRRLRPAVRAGARDRGAAMSDPPRVSVITPTWQRHDMLIDRCIPSVQAQGYLPWTEHIVVSDGPDPDLHRKLLDPWKNGWKNLYYNWLPEHDPEQHYGHYARALGIETATGEYITYNDDDDALRPLHCQLLAQALDDNPDAGFAVSRMVSHGQNGAESVIGHGDLACGNVGTPMIMHRRRVLETATWDHAGQYEDWDLVWAWMQAGIPYVRVDAETVDVWPSVFR